MKLSIRRIYSTTKFKGMFSNRLDDPYERFSEWIREKKFFVDGRKIKYYVASKEIRTKQKYLRLVQFYCKFSVWTITVSDNGEYKFNHNLWVLYWSIKEPCNCKVLRNYLQGRIVSLIQNF